MTPRSGFVLLIDGPDSPTWDPWGAAAWRALDKLNRVMAADVEALELVRRASVVIDPGPSVTPALAAAAADTVRLWQLLSVGHDGFSLRALHDAGVPVACSPGSTSAAALAEHAFALMLLTYAGIPLVSDVGLTPTMPRRELRGKLLLLIGYGASARRLAALAVAARMRVRAVARHAGPPALRGVQVDPWHRLDALLPEADVVSLHVPATRDTRGLMDARRLALMKDGAAIVNVSRGSLIDESELVRQLRSHRLIGAGLDVVANEPLRAVEPLVAETNAKLTPHVAGYTLETANRRGRFAASNARRVLRGSAPRCLIRVEDE